MTSRPLSVRLSAHFARANSGRDHHIHRSIRKHGKSAFRIFPIEQCSSRGEASRREQLWIDGLNTMGARGYNASSGGEGAGVAEGNSNSTLNSEAVLEARNHFLENDSVSVGDLATRYDVSLSTMASVLRGDHWQSVEMPDGLTDKFVTAKMSQGEKNPSSQLDSDDVRKIRQRAESDESYSQIASDFGVTVTAVRRAATGKTWQHVGGTTQDVSTDMAGASNPSSKLSSKDASDIRYRYEKEDVTYKQLAKEYDVTAGAIGNIIRGDSF